MTSREYICHRRVFRFNDITSNLSEKSENKNPILFFVIFLIVLKKTCTYSMEIPSILNVRLLSLYLYFVYIDIVLQQPSTRSDVFAVVVDLGNTYSSYAFSEIHLSKTAYVHSATHNKYGILEKIPTSILLNANLTLHSFGWKAKEQYEIIQGTEEAKRFHYFEHFITSIYETKAKVRGTT